MIRLLHDGPQTGGRNMAADESLMNSAREGLVTVRFYGWEPGALSFGRNQTAAGKYDAEMAAVRSIDIVRRPTGGRTVYHHRELTYCVTAPAELWGSLREAYCRINQALASGLQSLGAPVVCVSDGVSTPAPRPTARACFSDPLPGEVTAEGRKLVGSAQWRDKGALLQHGSILLINEQRVTEELRMGAGGQGAAARQDADTGAIGLSDLLSRVPPVVKLVKALAAGFETEFDTEVRAGSFSTAETRTSDRLLARYTDPAWTWRR
ncbi:MAG: lipoate--protein ligase family protein [Gemmatimonadales bacterium]|nr:MAG: lipoate--protein ligase family protein [Gemmatimonadales bacterium]